MDNTLSLNPKNITAGDKKIIYLCDDTVEGIFTAIYLAWSFGTSKTDVRVRCSSTLSFFEEYKDISTDYDIASKVSRSIITKLSYDVYTFVYYACLSNDPEKGSYIYRFLIKAFKKGPCIIDFIQDFHVSKVFELSRKVSREACYYREFIRFEELSNGVLRAKISPKYNISHLLTDHFSDRFSCEDWIIFDTLRNSAIIHKKYKAAILADGITEKQLDEFCDISAKESDFQALWKRFFDTIAIEERINTNLQRNNMPLHFRKYMNAEK